MECISYKKGYKYQLVREYSMGIPVRPDSDIETEYIILNSEGKITIKK